MKGSITLKILEITSDVAGKSADLIESFLSAGYGASRGSMRFAMKGIHDRQARREREREIELVARQRLHNVIYQLKLHDLIEETSSKNVKSFLKLTTKGIGKLLELNRRKERIGNLPSFVYPKINSNEIIIVTFDIPETERDKRAWFRSVLKNLGFKMVHQSFWIGKVKIPKELPNDLRDLRLIEFIEVFAISKTGSLKKFW